MVTDQPITGALALARVFARDGRRWRTTHEAYHLLEQLDDGPIEWSRPFTDPDATLRAWHGGIRARLDDGWSEQIEPFGLDAPAQPRLPAGPWARHPMRGSCPPVLADPDRARSSLRTAVDRLGDYLEEAATEGPAVAAAAAWLRDPSPPCPAGGLALFLLAADVHPLRPDPLGDVVELLAAASIPRALESLGAYLAHCADWPVLPRSDDARGQHGGGDFTRDPGPWQRLRQLLAGAGPAAYDAAVRAAEAIRTRAPVEVAYAFPDEVAWAVEAVGNPKKLKGAAPQRWLLTCTLPVALAVEVARRTAPLDTLWRGRNERTEAAWGHAKLPWVPWRWDHTLAELDGGCADDFTLAVVAAHGVDAAAILAALATELSRPRWPTCSAWALESIHRALLHVPTEAASRWAAGGASGDIERARRDQQVRHLRRLAEVAPRRVLGALLASKLDTAEVRAIARTLRARLPEVQGPDVPEEPEPRAPRNPFEEAVLDGDADRIVALLEAPAAAVAGGDDIEGSRDLWDFVRAWGLCALRPDAFAALADWDGCGTAVWVYHQAAGMFGMDREAVQVASQHLRLCRTRDALELVMASLEGHFLIDEATEGLLAYVEERPDEVPHVRRRILEVGEENLYDEEAQAWLEANL